MDSKERRELVAIDPYMLDEELMKQPTLYDMAQEKAANALRMRDTAKDDLDKLKADTLLRVHADPESFGLTKVTGDIANAAVDADEHVVRAKRLLSSMQKQLAEANGFVKSVDTKKKALEGLIQLHTSNYFSVPNQGKEVEGGKRYSPESVSKQRERIQQNDDERKESRKAARNKLANEGVKEDFDKACDKEDEKDGREKTATPSGRRGSRRRRG